MAEQQQLQQEASVTAGGESHPLPDPFFVLAPQNPIEQEGTYPLPEAQLDRFMFHVQVDYPDSHEELAIIKQTTDDKQVDIQPVMDAERIGEIGELVRQLPIADHVASYGLGLVRTSRPDREEATDMVREYVSWGAGPRAVQYLVLGAKGRAALRGNYMASLEDIEAVTIPVLSHRVITNFAAESQGMTSKKVVERLAEEMRED